MTSPENGNQYNERIGWAISRSPELSPEDVAAREVADGILAPLNELREALGLSESDIEVINRYASFASSETRRRKETEMMHNPLMLLDSIFAKEAVSLENVTYRDPRIFHLELARKSLRNTEQTIRTRVAAVVAQLADREELNLATVIEQICADDANNPRAEVAEGKMDGYFYTELANGRVQDYYRFMTLIGASEGDSLANKRVKTMQSMHRERASIHGIVTNISDVIGEIPDFTREYDNPHLRFGVVFTKEAILQIASNSSMLPPLSN